MTKDERHERIKDALMAYTTKITASAAEARSALVKEGIYTKGGKLTKHYVPVKVTR